MACNTKDWRLVTWASARRSRMRIAPTWATASQVAEVMCAAEATGIPMSVYRWDSVLAHNLKSVKRVCSHAERSDIRAVEEAYGVVITTPTGGRS